MSWRPTSKAHPCQVCGHPDWCSYTEDGAVTCQRMHGQAMPGWRIVKGPDETRGGTVYRRLSDPGAWVRPSPQEEKQQKEQDEARRAKEIERARELWAQAVPDHPLAAAYLESRGVRVADLPGGKLPASIRAAPQVRGWLRGESGEWTEVEGPVFVAAVTRGDELIGLQRIYLTPEGRKRAGSAKMALGALMGGAVRLGGKAGTLILTEGVETGLAVLAATGQETWACVSTSGLKALEKPAAKRVVIAGDYDRADERTGVRPGEQAALAAAARLGAKVALPSYDVCPELIAADGAIVDGKSVDWLDVLRHCGPEAVREAVQAAVRPTTPAPPQEPDELLPSNPLQRARMALRSLYTPEACVPWRGLRLRRWDGEWWRHNGVRYELLSEEGLRKDCRQWMNGYKVFHARTHQARPYDPPEHAVTELLANLQTDTLVHAPQMPIWLPPDFDEHGNAVMLGRRPWETSIAEEQRVGLGLPDPRRLIPFRNGIFDVDAWLQGKVLLHPHTERLLSTSSLPYELPAAELQERLSDDGLEDWIEELAPLWCEFLGLVSGGDQEWVELLQTSMGYSLTPDTSHEVILVMSGATRAGKGTILSAWTSLLGEDAVVSSDLNLLTRPFYIASLIGKALMVMPDADVGRSTDGVLACEVLKKISGNDPLYADRKHKPPIDSVRVSCKTVIMCNRMPSIPDPSGALAARFRVLAFEESALGQERREFKDPATIAREAVGRMIWALVGLRKLHRAGRFLQPARGQDLLDEYRDYADPLRRFVEECLEHAPGSWEPTRELYRSWTEWCKAAGRDPHSDAWFAKELRAAMPGKLKRAQRTVDGARVSGYEGVRVAPTFGA